MMRSSGQEYASVDFNKIGVGGGRGEGLFAYLFSWLFCLFLFFVRRPDVIFKKEKKKKKEGINLMIYLFFMTQCFF